MTEAIHRLIAERDLAITMRDAAREASARDLEARRQAQAALAAYTEGLSEQRVGFPKRSDEEQEAPDLFELEDRENSNKHEGRDSTQPAIKLSPEAFASLRLAIESCERAQIEDETRGKEDMYCEYEDAIALLQFFIKSAEAL